MRANTNDLIKFQSRIFLRYLIASLFIVLFSFQSKAQSKEQIEVMNMYVEFLNKSVHGLFTAHALLVINNKEVNKYVNLDSYSLFNLTNSQVQSNLFDISDMQNYRTFQGNSPMQLADLVKEKSAILNPLLADDLNGHVDKIKIILTKVNDIRFIIADYIETQDLNNKEAIYGVYDLLEEASSLFDQYAYEHKEIVDGIGSVYVNTHTDLYLKARDFHGMTKAILMDLRQENKSSSLLKMDPFLRAFDNLEREVTKFNNYDKKSFQSYLINRKDSIYEHLSRLKGGRAIPRQDRLYGEFYYYHNLIAKRFFNWSGPGFVRHLNNIMTDLGAVFVNFSEEPLIFKVMYPELLNERNFLSREEKQQDMLVPLAMEFANSRYVTKPDLKYYISIELYDFNMFDRDTISVFLDGECVLKDHPLTWEEKELEIEMEKGKEYLLEIQAENLGIISPNTAAISYRLNGNRQRFYTESYLKPGERLKIPVFNDGSIRKF